MNLKEFFSQNPKVALGFSGGVDSSYLLYAAKKYGADVKAYYVKTIFQPQFEFDDVKRLAKSIGAEITVLNFDILTDSTVRANPKNRCYYCKQNIFGMIANQAKNDGYSVIIDGTNASDEVSDRPGMRALTELSVKSPLRECDLTKTEIRKLSEEAGLFTYNKPSYACLATRIPSGTEITEELITLTERAEDELFKLGFSDFRIRYFCGAARLQVTQNDTEKAIELRKEICQKLSPYYNEIFLDMKGR